MKPILITGPTGFLGRHLVRLLRESPEQPPLRLFCFGESPWDDDSSLEIVRGNITDAAAVDQAMEGAAQVYHLAGFVSRNRRDRDRLHQVHVTGTRNVCEAALKHRPDKIVMTSSSGTIAVSRDPVVHNETSGYKEDVVAAWPYYVSKIHAEKAALDYWDRHRLPIVVVNPALLLGPGDVFHSSTNDVALFLEGQITSIPRGGMSFVDVRDCGAGLISAMRQGRPGERYLLAGPNWTFRDIIQSVARLTGLRPPRLSLPTGAALMGARLMRLLMPLLGKSFKVDDATIIMSGYFWYCDSSKAAAELGFTVRDPLVTLRDTVEDIRARK